MHTIKKLNPNFKDFNYNEVFQKCSLLLIHPYKNKCIHRVYRMRDAKLMKLYYNTLFMKM